MALPLTIMELPTELRALIYNELPQADAFIARLVCKKWRDEIDEFYVFEGRINTRQANWRQILQFPMRTCIIECLEEEKRGEQEHQEEGMAEAAALVAGGNQAETEQAPILQLSDFRHPDKLEWLVMTGPTLISALLAHKILTSDITNHLRELYFPLKLLHCSESVGSLSTLSLERLRSLELQAHAGIYIARGQQAMANQFVEILTNPTLRILKHLKLEVNMGVSVSSCAPNITAKYLLAILTCLSQQSNNFETLSLDFMGGTDPDAAVYLLQVQIRNRRVLLDFSNVRSVKKLNLSFDSETYTNVWTYFLERQQSLVNVELNGVWGENLLARLIPRNSDTIQSFSICCPPPGFRAQDTRSINCALFKPCFNLETLKIKIPFGNLLNVFDLPDSLITFETEGCEIDSDDLEEHAAEYAAPLRSQFLFRCILHNVWAHREGICRLLVLVYGSLLH